jgi:hypothetical protein
LKRWINFIKFCFLCLLLNIAYLLLKLLYILFVVSITFVVILGIIWICWLGLEYFYYKSERFLVVKSSIEENTTKCNDLNKHIETLKKAYINIRSIDYGQAVYTDQSNFNFKRSELKHLQKDSNIYHCSLSVCKGAEEKPFKYLCKYFSVKTNEQTLSEFENVLNDFAAAEQGKVLLKNERERIVNDISDKVPFLIRQFSRKLSRKLGFEDIDFSDLYFPEYRFQYVSPGGNSSMSSTIVFNIENLEDFIEYLSELVKFSKSIEGQRRLMTCALREQIKRRDNYTCQSCDLSTTQEPNLLLEIDHIIPLSKGGITTEKNLQTLCWRCNRSKGNKII